MIVHEAAGPPGDCRHLATEWVGRSQHAEQGAEQRVCSTACVLAACVSTFDAAGCGDFDGGPVLLHRMWFRVESSVLVGAVLGSALDAVGVANEVLMLLDEHGTARRQQVGEQLGVPCP